MSIFEKLKKNNSQKIFTEEEKEEYEKYIEKNFGKIEGIIHELVSPDIHVDIIVIAPTKEDNFYKLITMGMGAYKMTLPRQLNKYSLERAELVLYLPPSWNINSNEEQDYWPIRYLKTLARLPLQSNSWLGTGHTIATNEKNEPFSNNTELCSILLLNATNLKNEELELTINKNKIINFYQLFPLYLEELQYKFNYGTTKLLELFQEEDLIPIINIKRKNYCEEKKDN